MVVFAKSFTTYLGHTIHVGRALRGIVRYDGRNISAERSETAEVDNALHIKEPGGLQYVKGAGYVHGISCCGMLLGNGWQ